MELVQCTILLSLSPLHPVCALTNPMLLFWYIVGVVVIIAIAIIVAVIVTIIVISMSGFPSVPYLTPKTKPLLIVVLCW
jgi:hypothetical protein